MPLFKYIATDMEGHTHKGILDSDSAQQVRLRLHELGLLPIDIIEIEKKGSYSWPLFRFLKNRVSLADLSLFTFQLGTLLSAGLSLESALDNIAQQIDKPPLNTVLLKVRSLVLEGHTLAYSMNEFPDIFPKLYQATIASGEQAGNLDYIVNKLGAYLEQQENMRQKIIQALVYPALLTLVSLLIIGFLLSYTMPKILAIFQDTGQPLPEITLVLLSLSNILKTKGCYFLILLFVGLAFFKKMLKLPKFREQIHLLLLKLPLINTTLLTINAARFFRTLGILLAATVPILDAMRNANNTISLIPMHAAVEKALFQVGEGSSLHQALLQTGYFSKLSTQLIASGEASGKLEIMLEKTANYQDKNTIRRIDMALSLFEPLTILFMGLVVLFIVLATLLPIFEMNQFFS